MLTAALEGDREPLAGGAGELALQLGGREPEAICHPLPSSRS